MTRRCCPRRVKVFMNISFRSLSSFNIKYLTRITEARMVTVHRGHIINVTYYNTKMKFYSLRSYSKRISDNIKRSIEYNSFCVNIDYIHRYIVIFTNNWCIQITSAHREIMTLCCQKKRNYGWFHVSVRHTCRFF